MGCKVRCGCGRFLVVFVVMWVFKVVVWRSLMCYCEVSGWV